MPQAFVNSACRKAAVVVYTPVHNAQNSGSTRMISLITACKGQHLLGLSVADMHIYTALENVGQSISVQLAFLYSSHGQLRCIQGFLQGRPPNSQ